AASPAPCRPPARPGPAADRGAARAYRAAPLRASRTSPLAMIAQVVTHDVLDIHAVEVAPALLRPLPDGLQHPGPQLRRRVLCHPLERPSPMLLICPDVRVEEPALALAEAVAVAQRRRPPRADRRELRLHSHVEAGHRLLPGALLAQELQPVAQRFRGGQRIA